MTTRNIIKPVFAAFGTVLVASMLAFPSANAADQFEWLTRQLAISDGTTPDVSDRSSYGKAEGVAGKKGDAIEGKAGDPGKEDDYLSRQLRMTDGFSE